MISTLRITALIGLVIFGFSFALTFLSPIHYEKAARGFLEWKIEEQVRTRLDVMPEEMRKGRIARFARSMAERHDTEIAGLHEQLRAGLKDKVATIVGRMQDVSCECRQVMTRALNIVTRLQISSLERAEPQLRRMIEGQYGEIVADLLRELRIFTATNLGAFALLLGISFARPAHAKPLLVPATLLVGATVVASALYIFGQNWFFALLYNDYVGFGYTAWLVIIYAFLLDIALFQARITSFVLDAMTQVMGKVFSTIPC